MRDLAPILPKILPLVRMLATDSDGERLNAVRLLGKTLKSAGASFHDLADAIGGNPAQVDEYGEAYWKPPSRRYAGSADFVAPRKPRRPPPKVSGPPLWEALNQAGRMAWLTKMTECDKLTVEQRTLAGELRAQAYSQPHKVMKPAQAAAINAIFAMAWVQYIRPIADVAPGDPRLPLRWSAANRESVKLVLQKAAPYLSHRDAQFARSAADRIQTNQHAFLDASNDELERLEQVLVEAYDLGARP